MVLSLAFILAFVGSAVALLIGILIYSDIQDAMAQTFVVNPESTLNFGQNGFGEIKVIPTNVVNLASTYTGLDPTSAIIKVTIPIAGVEDNFVIKPPIDIEGNQGTGSVDDLPSFAGLAVWKLHVLTSSDGLIAGTQINTIQLQSDSSGNVFNAHIGIYDNVNHFITQSDIVNVTPNGNFYTWTFSPPFTIPPNEIMVLMVGADNVFHFKGLVTPSQLDHSTSGSNTVSVIFPNFPMDWEFDGTGSAVGQPNLIMQIDSILPKPFEVGLYDSSFNLLSSQSGSVTTDQAQDLVVTFTTPVPNDQIVSVGIFGSSIEFLGDTTNSLFSSEISGIENPFVADPTEKLDVFIGDRSVTNSAQGSDFIWKLTTFNTALGMKAGEFITAVELHSANSGASFNMIVGLYDSSNQLLGLSDEINVIPDGSYFSFPFSTPVITPLDETVTTMLFSDTPFFLQGQCFGSCSSGGVQEDNGNTYPNFPSTWVFQGTGNTVGFPNTKLVKTFDGLTPSSQRTVIEVFTGELSEIPESFAQANNVALTVLGIVPVALFFFLFAIFSGRVGE